MITAFSDQPLWSKRHYADDSPGLCSVRFISCLFSDWISAASSFEMRPAVISDLVFCSCHTSWGKQWFDHMYLLRAVCSTVRYKREKAGWAAECFSCRVVLFATWKDGRRTSVFSETLLHYLHIQSDLMQYYPNLKWFPERENNSMKGWRVLRYFRAPMCGSVRDYIFQIILIA